jgi:hypothetical protein
MEDKNEEQNTNLLNAVRTLILRGALDFNAETQGNKKNTTKNKEAFNKNKAMAAEAARLFHSHGCSVTSIKTWANKNGSSGLNEGSASALMASAFEYAKKLGLVNSNTTMGNGQVGSSFKVALFDCEAIASHIAEHLSDDGDDELAEDEDLLAEDDPLAELLSDETSEASVQSDTMVSLEEIVAVLQGSKDDKVAFLKGAQLAFLSSDNADGSNFHCFRNGKSKRGGISIEGKNYNLTKLGDFILKVAQHAGLNLAGLASWRGKSNKDWGSDLLKNRDAQLNLSIAWCVVAVKAEVVKFNHDLRKYISDETIKALSFMTLDPAADLTHDSAPTNGWLLPYQRGEKQALHGDTFKALINDLLI